MIENVCETSVRALATAVLAVAVVATGCHGASGRDQPPQAQSQRASMAPTLEWEEARPADRATAAHLPGRVEMPRHQVVEQGPPVDIVIDAWRVAEGSQVEIGDTLAVVRSPALADLAAEVGRLRQLAAKRREVVEHREEGVASGFVTNADVLEAEVALAETESELRAARRRLSSRRGASLKRDGTSQLWVATATGRVAEVRCAAGPLQEAGTTCLEIVPESRAEVRVDVPQRMSQQLGDDVRAVWQAIGRPKASPGVSLVMARRAGRLSPTNHTRAYYFRPDEPASGAEMIVGEAGYVTLDIPVREGTVLVERLSVTRMDGEPTIFVERDGKPEPLPVEIRGQFGTDYLVHSPDLQAGTRVVVRGAFNLKSQRILQ